MEIFNLIFRYIFFGFIIWTFVWVFSANKHATQHGTDRFDLFVVRIVMGFGVLQFIILIFNFIEFSPEGIKISESLSSQALGKYWFGWWMYPITYFGLTQLLWIRKVRTSKVLRIVMALWIFGVMHFEIFVILVTSLHRNHVPASWQ